MARTTLTGTPGRRKCSRLVNNRGRHFSPPVPSLPVGSYRVEPKDPKGSVSSLTPRLIIRKWTPLLLMKSGRLDPANTLCIPSLKSLGRLQQLVQPSLTPDRLVVTNILFIHMPRTACPIRFLNRKANTHVLVREGIPLTATPNRPLTFVRADDLHRPLPHARCVTIRIDPDAEAFRMALRNWTGPPCRSITLDRQHLGKLMSNEEVDGDGGLDDASFA